MSQTTRAKNRYDIFVAYTRVDGAVGVVEAQATTIGEARESTAYLCGYYSGQGHTITHADIRRGGTLLTREHPVHLLPTITQHQVVPAAIIDQQRRAFADLGS